MYDPYGSISTLGAEWSPAKLTAHLSFWTRPGAPRTNMGSISLPTHTRAPSEGAELQVSPPAAPQQPAQPHTMGTK